ncbi:hypothetical protein E8E11_010466 [Didymella keratinophila]|nr:hypothetical protein E8E11_010466 [Didymella keratinophila]
MYMNPVDILRLKRGHHLTYHKGGHTDPSSSTQSGFSQPMSLVDRDSAIALGVLLVLILTLAGWFCWVQVQKKKERDAKQQLWRQASVSIQRGGSVGVGTLRSSSEKMYAATPSFPSRADFGMSALATGGTDGWRVRHTEDEKPERRWQAPGSQSHSPGPSRQQNGTASVLWAPGDHRRSSDRERPLSPLAQAISLQDRPMEPQVPRRASCHRRWSSVRSIDAFVPPRWSSLSQIQYDKRWESEVAAHGGCTARANRRLSTLAPILEPEAALQASDFDDVHV